MRVSAALTVAACGLVLCGLGLPGGAAAQSSPRTLESVLLSRPLLVPDLEDLAPEVRAQLTEAFAQLELHLRESRREPAAEVLARVGRLLAKSYRREAALAAFQGLLELSPDDFSAHYLTGTLHAQLGQDALAEEMYLRALELRADDLPTRVRLGQLRLRGGDVGGAEQAFSAVSSGSEREPAVLFGLGEVRRLRRDCGRAVELYREALRLQPSAAGIHYPLGLCLRDLGDLEGARHHLSQHRDQPVSFEDPLVDDLVVSRPGKLQLLLVATEMSARGRIEDALRAYGMVLELEPENPSALRGIATGSLRTGQVDRGRDALERLVAAEPDDVRAWTDLGQVRRQLGDLRNALAAVERAVELVPSYARAHLMRGELLAETGDSAGAATSFRRAYSSAREIEADREVRGWSALLLGQLVVAGAGEDGVALLEESLELLPDDAEAQRQAARALVQASSFARGGAAFARAASLEPGDAASHFASGLAYMLGGEDPRARAVLERGLVHHGSDPRLRELLARLLACSTRDEVKNPARAVQLAQTAFDAAPGFESARTLAMALVASGDVTTGTLWLQRALQRARELGDGGRVTALESQIVRAQAGETCSAPWLEARG